MLSEEVRELCSDKQAVDSSRCQLVSPYVVVSLSPILDNFLSILPTSNTLGGNIFMECEGIVSKNL